MKFIIQSSLKRRRRKGGCGKEAHILELQMARCYTWLKLILWYICYKQILYSIFHHSSSHAHVQNRTSTLAFFTKFASVHISLHYSRNSHCLLENKSRKPALICPCTCGDRAFAVSHTLVYSFPQARRSISTLSLQLLIL